MFFPEILKKYTYVFISNIIIFHLIDCLFVPPRLGYRVKTFNSGRPFEGLETYHTQSYTITRTNL